MMKAAQQGLALPFAMMLALMIAFAAAMTVQSASDALRLGAHEHERRNLNLRIHAAFSAAENHLYTLISSQQKIYFSNDCRNGLCATAAAPGHKITADRYISSDSGSRTAAWERTDSNGKNVFDSAATALGNDKKTRYIVEYLGTETFGQRDFYLFRTSVRSESSSGQGILFSQRYFRLPKP